MLVLQREMVVLVLIFRGEGPVFALGFALLSGVDGVRSFLWAALWYDVCFAFIFSFSFVSACSVLVFSSLSLSICACSAKVTTLPTYCCASCCACCCACWFLSFRPFCIYLYVVQGLPVYILISSCCVVHRLHPWPVVLFFQQFGHVDLYVLACLIHWHVLIVLFRQIDLQSLGFLVLLLFILPVCISDSFIRVDGCVPDDLVCASAWTPDELVCASAWTPDEVVMDTSSSWEISKCNALSTRLCLSSWCEPFPKSWVLAVFLAIYFNKCPLYDPFTGQLLLSFHDSCSLAIKLTQNMPISLNKMHLDSGILYVPNHLKQPRLSNLHM